MSEASAVRTVKLENSPAPKIAGHILRELEQIGGIVPHGFGHFSKKLRIALLWGQSALAFDAGKMRIRFFDQQVDPIYRARKFRLSKKGWSSLAAFQRLKDQKLNEAFKNLDWKTYHAVLFAPMEYFLNRFVPRAEWEHLPENSSFEATAKLLPDGWMYFEDLPEVAEIGCPNFYLCQWTDGDGINARASWERNRFGIHPLMEFYGQEHFVDILGEYPVYGDYANVLFKIETETGDYAEPSEQNCLEPLRRMIKEAKERRKSESTVDYRVKKRIENEGEKLRLASHARSQKRKEIFEQEGQVIRYGSTARIYPKDRRTKWGKPTVTANADGVKNELKEEKK